MAGELQNELIEELSGLDSAGLRRTLRVVSGPQQTRIQLDGRKVLHFSSNDYLGLANHPRLRAAATAAIEQHGEIGIASVKIRHCPARGVQIEMKPNLLKIIFFRFPFHSCFHIDRIDVRQPSAIFPHLFRLRGGFPSSQVDQIDP